MTQCDLVMQYMKDYGSISPLEAFRDLGITRLSARIYELRKSGVPIIGETEKAKTRYGATAYYTRYRLAIKNLNKGK